MPSYARTAVRWPLAPDLLESVATVHISKRRACKTFGQARSTQRHHAVGCADEDALTAAVVAMV